jgi:cell wall-associated NlpC family hydrolase
MRGRSTLVIALCSLLVLLVVQPAVADTPRQRLARAQERLDELSRELEIQIEECNLRREQRKAAERAVADNRRRYEKTEKRLASVRDERAQVVAQLYKDRSVGQQLAQLTTSADSLTDFAERVTWLDIAQEARTTAFERFTATQARLTADGDVLRTVREQAEKADAVAQRSCDETRERVEAEEGQVAELDAEVERLESAARARSAEDDADSGSPSAAAPAPAVSGSAGAAVQFALAQVGKPYGWGGSGPNSYDCSGLMMAAWAAAGVSLPHNSGMQYSATTRVSRDQIQPGDILFFGSPIHHDAMYIGNGQMVEAPRTGLTVRVVSIDRSDYVGAGRP